MRIAHSVLAMIRPIAVEERRVASTIQWFIFLCLILLRVEKIDTGKLHIIKYDPSESNALKELSRFVLIS